MKSRILLCLMTFMAFLYANVHAFNDEPQCFKSLKTTFFRQELVYTALNIYQIPQSQWPSVYQKVANVSQQVPALVAQRTARMVPSPLDYPFNGNVARQILLDILYTVFRDAVHESLVTNEDVIKGMFNYIKEQQQSLLDSCLGPETTNTPGRSNG